MNIETTPSIDLNSLNIPEVLLRSISEMGYTQCTPIQAASLPLALNDKDVAGQAQTGTGKTAAFLIATYAYLLRHPITTKTNLSQPRAIIIAPTRELAIQIHKDAEQLGKYTPFRLSLVYGGTGYTSQRDSLEQGVDILIGTPGRIIDYLKQRIFSLKSVQVMVLDEADRMFDLGFLKDIRYLLRLMPKPEKRLSLLFSATLSARVEELAYEHMNNPSQIVIESQQVTAENVTELVYFPATEEKIPLLLGILRGHEVTRTMVFVNTKIAAATVQGYLRGNDYECAVLSGDVPQNQRTHLLKEFTDGKIPILIATDVAARGLHIPAVSHVINYDLPQDAEDYVHRIGRTARAGAKGDAISFACEEYSFSLGEIETYIGHKIPVEHVTSELLVTPRPPVREKHQKPSHAKGSEKKRGGNTTRKSTTRPARHRHTKTS